MNATRGEQGGRVGELDALRGIAAIAVVAFHYTTRFGEVFGASHAPPVSVRFGNYGVQLFFLISGFVIFMTLERTRRPLDFVVSRFSRLFPAYWASILVSASVIYTIGASSQRIPIQDLAIDFTMIQQFLGARHLDGVYWTLQVELFFYAQMLVWFVLGMLGRIRWIIVAWLIAGIGFRLAVDAGMDDSPRIFQLLILDHLPFFGIGILMYERYRGRGSLVTDVLLIGACIAQVILTREPVYALVVAVCTLTFTLFIAGHLRWLRWAPLAFLGTISYALYLLHQAIGFAVMWRLEEVGVQPVAAALVAFVTCAILAVGVTFLIERPARDLIRGFWSRRGEPRWAH